MPIEIPAGDPAALVLIGGQPDAGRFGPAPIAAPTSRGAVYLFPGITIPAAANDGLAFDRNGVAISVPTFQTGTTSQALIAGNPPPIAKGVSVHLVDRATSVTWTTATLAVRRSNSATGLYEALATPLSLSKNTRFQSVVGDDLDSAYIGCVWTAVESGAVPDALDLYIFVRGE